MKRATKRLTIALRRAGRAVARCAVARCAVARCAVTGCALAGCALSGDYDFEGHALDPSHTGSAPCKPLTCDHYDARCGVVPDGCGRMLSCGHCELPDTCGGGGTSYRCGCQPRTCEEAGAACGRMDDGCGKQRECGKCPPGFACGLLQDNRCAPSPGKESDDDDGDDGDDD